MNANTMKRSGKVSGAWVFGVLEFAARIAGPEFGCASNVKCCLRVDPGIAVRHE